MRLVSDLVSGVLTRLAEIEAKAQRAHDELTRAHAGELDGSVKVRKLPDWWAHANTQRPSAVLRLCRAHRQIVERHSTQHELVDGFCVGHAGDCAEVAAEWCSVCDQEPCDTLRDLAVGLGVVEEEDR